jgi:hypothetical protein
MDSFSISVLEILLSKTSKCQSSNFVKNVLAFQIKQVILLCHRSGNHINLFNLKNRHILDFGEKF